MKTQQFVKHILPALCALALVFPAALCAQENDGQELAAAGQELATATFAGGCFWSMEKAFDQVDGVVRTTSGYMGGEVRSPSYEQVLTGRTGHVESVRVIYDSAVVSYRELLYNFWRNIDPLARNRQFCDTGVWYQSVIFYDGEEERRLALASKGRVARRFEAPIETGIKPASEFWPAAEYHQDFYQKNPVRYKLYAEGCGRAGRLQELWGDEAGGEVPHSLRSFRDDTRDSGQDK